MIRIIERPSIVLKDIDFAYDSNVNIDEASGDIGRTPFVQIGSQYIESKSIISLSLYNDQFLPRINMKFKDSSGKLLDALFPLDESVVKTFIQSSNDNLMPIRMDFKITKFNPLKTKQGDNNDVVIELDGILNVDNLYNSPFNSYDDTTYNIIKKIAIESKLGFSSNIDNTNDKMVWINPAELNIDFLQSIVQFSFKSIDTFLYAYIDFYYNLNYIDIETALNEDIKDQKAFIGNKFISNFSSNKNDSNEIGDLILTNHPNNINSNIYINGYDISNTSTGVNLEIGYMYYSSYYDSNANIMYNLKLDTISTTGADGNNIILKGGIGEVTELQKTSIVNDYDGKVDTDNVHQYFLYAKKCNERNLKYLQKIKMKITILTPNFNLYRFQKVNLRLYRMNEFDRREDIKTKENNPKSSIENSIKDEDKMNQRLSGEWLISSINYVYNNSSFEQEVVLVRRELTFNVDDYNKDKSY